MPSAPKTLAAYVLAIESIEERAADARKLVESLESLSVAEEVALVPAIYWKDEASVIGFLTRFPEHTFSESYLCKCLVGQLATTLSHISIWRRLLESGHEGALVFEDDMYISDAPKFMEVVAEVRQRKELEWVRIHLHKKFRAQVLQLRDQGLLVNDPMPWGFATYYISRSGAKKMLNLCQNISTEIDWLPPLMRQHGLLDSKTVTGVVVEHHAFDGDEAEFNRRHEIDRLWYTVQKSASTIWTSPPVAENVRLHRFVSRLINIRELRQHGVTVLRGIFDKAAVAQARQLVLDNRDLLKNTRPSPSAGHLAGFHRFPTLEPLHTMLTGNNVILDFLRFLLKGMSVRSIGLSDITINRSQNWHKDLLRGQFKTHLNGSFTWEVDGGGMYKVLFYLQDGASLKVIRGSHIKPILLDNDRYSEPDEDADVAAVMVHAGDVVILDIRSSHRGADESSYASGQWDDDPRILISTALGGVDCKLTRAMEKGNFHRLMEWMDLHP